MTKRLHLDALFGYEPIEVEWGGQVYELRHIKSLGPTEIAKFERLYKRAQSFSKAKSSDVDTEELESVMRSTMDIICPEMAQLLPFLALARALQFYGEQVTPVHEKKKARQ